MKNFKYFYALLTFILGCQHKNVHTGAVKKDEKSQVLTPAGFERYTLRPQLIQKLPNGEDLNWGGFSGLRYIGQDSVGDLFFWAITDRGPNGEEFKKEGWTYRGFLVPDFHPSIVKLRASKAEKSLEVVQSIPLKNKTGEFLTGLPPENEYSGGVANYEVAVNAQNQRISSSGLGVDSESIAVDENDHFWVGEEYWPSILEFDPQGSLLAHIQPAAKEKQKLKENEIPYEYRFRRSNRGFEAMAYYKNRIYFMTQSPLAYEKKPKFIRIGVFNKQTRMYEAEYLYPVEHTKADKIGDMQMIDEDHFLVIQQNGDVGPDSTHVVYKVDISKATNLVKHPFALAPEQTTIRNFPRHFRFAQKTLVLDLVKQGYSDFEKVEGLAILDKNTIAVVNDNDFGVDGTHVIWRPTVLGLFKLNP